MLIALLLVAVISCRKSGVHETSGLVGTWEIRKSEGGIAATIDYPPGNGNRQIYDADGHFKWINDGLITQLGTYTLKQTSAIGEYELTIHSEVYGAVWTEKVLITKDQLVIDHSQVCCDMPTLLYVRVPG